MSKTLQLLRIASLILADDRIITPEVAKEMFLQYKKEHPGTDFINEHQLAESQGLVIQDIDTTQVDDVALDTADKVQKELLDKQLSFGKTTKGDGDASDKSQKLSEIEKKVKGFDTNKLEEFIEKRYEKGATQRELDLLETIYAERISEENPGFLDELEEDISDDPFVDLPSLLVGLYKEKYTATWSKTKSEGLTDKELANYLRETIHERLGMETTKGISDKEILDAVKDLVDTKQKLIKRIKEDNEASDTADKLKNKLLDKQYFDAVNKAKQSGNWNVVQKMVDDLASKKFNDSIVRQPRVSSKDIEQKPLKKVYHGTNSEFSVFEFGRTGITDWGWLGTTNSPRYGMFFSENKELAKNFAESKEGKRIVEAYLNIENPFYMDGQSLSDLLGEKANVLDNADIDNYDELRSQYLFVKNLYNTDEKWMFFDGEEGEKFVKNLQSQGYDGAFLYEEFYGADEDMPPQPIWVSFSSSKIKSAEPVVYDDDGNVIPLSQRFNKKNDNIRY